MARVEPSAAPVSPSGGAWANLALALGWHLLAGAVWLLGLWFGLRDGFGAPAAGVWAGSAAVLWFRAAAQMSRAVDRPGTVWRRSFEWWLQSWIAPAVVAVVAHRAWKRDSAQPQAVRPHAEADPVASEALRRRIAALERDLRRLEAELVEVRALAEMGDAEPWDPRAADVAPTGVEPARSREAAAAAPPPAPPLRPAPAWPADAPAPPPPPVRTPAPPWWERIDTADLLGARSLAWAGGVVTLLGVVFFFVLAVNRGWIGPVERVSLGALASAVVFAAGIVVRRRHGQLYSALAAVAAGLAGGFATLLAAAALYELLPDLAALTVAAGLAAVGVATALAWSAQTIAGLGLVGAMLVPVMTVFEGGLTVVGTAFAALLFAATAVVALARRWRELLAVGGLVSAAQLAGLVGQEGEGASAAVVVLAAAFWLLYLGTGVVVQRRSGSTTLDRLTTPFLLGSATVAASCAGVLLEGATLGVEHEGGAILVVAALYAALAAVFFPRERERDLSALLAALALALAAIGLADVLGGTALTVAWAAEAALLAWLAGRVRETRFAAGAVAYLLLALGHVLTVDAPLTHLYAERERPATGALAVLALAAAALLVARFAPQWPAPAEQERTQEFLDRHPIRAAFAAFAAGAAEIALAAAVVSALAAVYAASLGVLELFQRLDVVEAFEWGHVAVSTLWALVGAAALLGGARLDRRRVEVAGLVWLAATVANVLIFALPSLAEPRRGWAALAVAAVVLLVGYAYALLRAPRRDVERAAVVMTAVAVALASVGIVELVDGAVRGVGLRGIAFLAAGAVCGALAVPVFGRERSRDLATTLWGLGLVLAAVASDQLLSGTARVAAWSLAAAALAWLAARTREARLLVASLVFTALALGSTLTELAPPADLFVANHSPADGVLALAFTVLAAAAVARYSVFSPREPRDGLDERVALLLPRLRTYALAGIGVLSVYAVSLVVLEAAEELGRAALTTEFQRGHTAVSAFWGLVGLATLYLGLTRGRQPLRLAGFALFGVSLAKLFLYDLSTLSSITRALSFLAVGAVLLLAGFFYQRLTAQSEDREPRLS